MVAYVPPDAVLLAIGSTQKIEPLMSAAKRVLGLLQTDQKDLAPFGITPDDTEQLEEQLEELRVMLTDKRIAKNDTPLQMAEVTETMAQARAWMVTLRQLGSINLAVDTPALTRLCSSAPELPGGYPRDLLAELERRVLAAADMRPRLEEVGVNDAFVERGRRLARQLATAIGAQDLDGKNLPMAVRRFYVRKAQVYLRIQRAVRAGQVAFTLIPERARAYHLAELEPAVVEPPPKAVRPKRA